MSTPSSLVASLCEKELMRKRTKLINEKLFYMPCKLHLITCMVNEVQERKSETNKDMNTGSKRQRERESEV